jgi:tRNA G18 (ribose-2'-O)-methylase SpoU
MGLSDPELRRKISDQPFFIAEGLEVVRRLLISGLTVRSVMVAPNRLERLRPSRENVTCPVYVAERRVISATVGYAIHRGVIASAFRPTPPSLDDVLRTQPKNGTRHRFAVFQGVNDHENLGAIARSSHAFGIDALILDPTCTGSYYRRCVRVSMGEILFLPVITMTMEDLFSTVQGHHGTVVALTRAVMPRPSSKSPFLVGRWLSFLGPKDTGSQIQLCNLPTTKRAYLLFPPLIHSMWDTLPQ